MSLTVPSVLTDLIVKFDDPSAPVDELRIAGELVTALGDLKTLTPEERRGAYAEIEALRFARPHGSERRTWGIYWAELASWTSADGKQYYSPDIADIDDHILSHWIRRAASAKHPVLRARFADLSWEIGRFLKKSSKISNSPFKNSIVVDIPVSLCHQAIDGYLEAVRLKVTEDVHEAWQCLDRAIELSITINDADRLTKAKTELFTFYRKTAETDEIVLWWRFDDIIWERGKALGLDAAENEAIFTVLENALTVHSNISDKEKFDPHWALDAADRIVRRCGRESDEAKRAIKTAALAFEEAAKLAQGLVALAWLEDLIPRYRAVGLLDDAVRVERAIRGRAKEAQAEMKRIEVPVDIPKEELDKWVEGITGSTVSDALSQIAVACLIREDSAREGIKNITKNAPLFAMMSSSVMDDNGFTTASIGSVEDDLDGRAIQHAADLFNWYAPWLYLAFTGTKEKYGLDVEKIVAELSKSSFFAANREPLLREGLEAWLAEDPVKAIHVLISQLEAALRDIIAASGSAVMTQDARTGGFKVINMGAILEHQKFQGPVLKDISFHFRALYCDPRGINLRNRLAHGIAHPGLFNMGLANWVVHSLLITGLLRPKTSESNTNESRDAR